MVKQRPRPLWAGQEGEGMKMDVNSAKMGFLTGVGVAGGAIATALGGWDAGLRTLVTLMAADYITGLAIAVVWKRSPKTETGAASSDAGLKGLLKKGAMLLLVLVAVQLDLMIGIDYLRDGVIIALVVNELLSLAENMGLMGVPWPEPIKNAIELLTKKGGGGNA